jgi:predicted DNA-binding transcriptional regulator AlpA
MPDQSLRISVIGNASIAVDDVAALPSLPEQDIYIEKAGFRDVMTINRVAVVLGLSGRHLRRMIADRTFPSSVVTRGQTQYWLRQTVREWKKDQLRASTKRRSSRTSKTGRWDDDQKIENEEEREFLLKATETQHLMNDFREMRALAVSNPKELARGSSPAFKKWMKEKGFPV